MLISLRDEPVVKREMLETVCEFMDIKQEAEEAGGWADLKDFLIDDQLILLVIKQCSLPPYVPALSIRKYSVLPF